MLLERQVSGMIFAGGQYAEADAPHDHYMRLLQLRLPVVLVNAAADHLDFPRVSTDDAVAMEQAYAHLASLGHERIGLILGPPDHVPSRRKLAAFEARLARDGSALRAELVERTMFSLEGGHAAATKLIGAGRDRDRLRERPARARRDPRRAPRRALACRPTSRSSATTTRSFMSCTDPPLTTVRQPIEAIGRAAVEMLAGQIEGSPSRPRSSSSSPRSSPAARRAHASPRLSSPASPIACASTARKQVRNLQDFSRALAINCRLCHSRRVTQIATIAADAPEPAAARRRRPPTAAGGATPSSTRSTSGASPTRTATASATSPASAPGCRTCASSASTRSGSTPGTRRRSPTTATTSSTTARSIPPFGTLDEAEQLIAEARALGIRTIVDVVPNHVSNEHPWFQAALAVAARLARARALLVPARARRRTASCRRTAGSRSSAAPPGRASTRRRVVPPSLRARAARPQLDAPRRLGRARGRAALLVRPRRRRRADRLGGAARQGSGARARRRPTPRPGEHPFMDRDELHEIYRALARDRRRLRRAARARRRDLAARRRAARALPAPGRAAHRVQLRLPRLPLGARRRCAPRSTRRSPSHAPVDAPATWVLSNHDVTRPVTRYGASRHVVRVRVEARRHADRPRARHAPRPCRGAARDGAARLDVRLPGRGARPARGRGHPGRAPPGPDVAPLRRASTPAATAAACRCPGRATSRRTASAPTARAARGSTSPTTGRRSPSRRRAATPASMLEPLPRRPAAAPRRALGRGDDDPRGSRRPTPSSRSRAATDFTCLVNFGPDPVELPAGADVLIASNELEGGALPQDTTVWLRQA